MKKDYINNGYLLVMSFDDAYAKTVELLKDSENYTNEARYDLFQDFCSRYPYFDGSKLDKILMKHYVED